MTQWVNHLWNNIFVNLLPLPLLCEISGALHLMQLGRQVADEMQVNFEILKLTVHQNIPLFPSFSQGTASLQQY